MTSQLGGDRTQMLADGRVFLRLVGTPGDDASGADDIVAVGAACIGVDKFVHCSDLLFSPYKPWMLEVESTNRADVGRYLHLLTTGTYYSLLQLCDTVGYCRTR